MRKIHEKPMQKPMCTSVRNVLLKHNYTIINNSEKLLINKFWRFTDPYFAKITTGDKDVCIRFTFKKKF